MPKNNEIIEFTVEQVKQWLNEFYNLQVNVKPLVSYSDKNFLVFHQTDTRFIFKIANKDSDIAFLEAQNNALQFLAENAPGLTFPAIINTVDHLTMPRVTSQEGTTHCARLLTYLPGTFMGDMDAGFLSPELIENVGSYLGAMDNVLLNFDHPALHRHDMWDLRSGAELEGILYYIKDHQVRTLVHYFVQRFNQKVLPHLSKLRQSVIQCDGNNFNVLVAADHTTVKGIIDFGDMVYTCTVFELAIAIAYAVHNQENPMGIAVSMVRGYHRQMPLTSLELDLLYYLIACRLCMSITLNARQFELDPNNEYLNVSVKPAIQALEKLSALDPILVAGAFKKACGIHTPEHENDLEPKRIEELRQKYLGKSLSLSYKKPLKIVRGFMQYLYDYTGQAYLDTVNNVCHVGHCHPRVVAAAQNQMAQLNTNTRYLHDNIVEYAQRLTATLPDPLSVCFFVCTGSEANELALRMARIATGNHDFVVVDHAYHGNTNEIIRISPYKFDGPGGRGAEPFVHKTMMADPYRGYYKYDDPEAGQKYAADVERAFNQLTASGRNAAAFIHESIPGVGGQIVLPDGYLKAAYSIARKNGALCIADEVQIGFGRVGTHMWAFEQGRVVPDIVTMGKPIGNGHPMAAVVTTPEIADAFNNGMEYFNTFGGNPVSCAIGLAVLDVIRDEELMQNSKKVGAHMLKGLQGLKDKYPLIGDVRGTGLFIGIELVKHLQTLEPAKDEAYYIAERMKENHILISVDGPLHNVLKIKPPIVFTENNADQYVNTLDDVLAKMK